MKVTQSNCSGSLEVKIGKDGCVGQELLFCIFSHKQHIYPSAGSQLPGELWTHSYTPAIQIDMAVLISWVQFSDGVGGGRFSLRLVPLRIQDTCNTELFFEF